ncbi:hypothetical protein Bccel_2137 [Pseudobacteroides cellulosolvens ATCC 35603 = DSM 2933]|uniref:Uncharacterized protein n=1 Tax=Pseudobacteroides cellulosolvens ATCC 35603 = DSM 2933 TaxID=398512 RepID=A0A0L6JNC4_9FIRM|nr:hypothetical protein Bccel_2137 [Pseudobacteroides cellulosolvens ATCC 35603 = DSM 2933]
MIVLPTLLFTMIKMLINTDMLRKDFTLANTVESSAFAI